MSVKYYNYPADRGRQLSSHFKMGEFVDPSDYTSAPFPSTVPIDSDLIDILEQVRDHARSLRLHVRHKFRLQNAFGGQGC